MGRMKVLASIALFLAACVSAQAAEPTAPRPLAGSQMPPAQPLPPSKPTTRAWPEQGVKPSWISNGERDPKPAAGVAVLVTEDADSARLPAFATPTTPTPQRFMRFGVEWSF
jgi:hypothetical protein